MPKSKRSAKRRAKLKKRGNDTYNWAKRKVMTLTPEQIEALMQQAQMSVPGFQQIEDESSEQIAEERIENDVQG